MTASAQDAKQRYDATDKGVVTFVNTFTVTGDPLEFEEAFAKIAELLAEQPGFLQFTLSRHVDPARANEYVNIALWTDVQSWKDAIAAPGFAEHAKEIRARATNVANMYEPRQEYVKA
ncbi:antibiotic biosynthesis monooxygenase [Nocardia sp. CDC159]|uniref:Antibiotic biosynthesis monooxygenase n=1 Tax=Nocardia pulmonis TaxID=2951408 RepID=A0A9X2E0P5_9NOCA|nr:MULTISPECIES: antibiotic biosynthesis monooxygenase family protein [Nocardia]MCM6771857.1 antibiotic biosynthesis monooxygenase [Nocardia pulmonis]MCM6785485.1 antibiotic biosynthesis monooxygenase [Nocardia sp. CDC159]